MPYRMGRGDYYRGDYYRGSIFGSIGAAIKGGIGGIFGGPAGIIKGAITSSVKYNMNQGGGSSGAVAPIGSSTAATPVDQTPEELVRKHQVNIHKAQSSGAMTGKPGAGAVIVPHPVTGQPVLTSGRRRPHMRVTNPKALRRAIRRAEGFKKMALRVIRLVDPKRKSKSFAGFKRGRKR